MGILDLLGLRKLPDPNVGDRETRKAARIKIAKRKAANLPDSLDSPFFHDLLRRWDQPPTMAAPVSQLCTADQFEEEDYQRLCRLFKVIG